MVPSATPDELELLECPPPVELSSSLVVDPVADPELEAIVLDAEAVPSPEAIEVDDDPEVPGPGICVVCVASSVSEVRAGSPPHPRAKAAWTPNSAARRRWLITMEYTRVVTETSGLSC